MLIAIAGVTWKEQFMLPQQNHTCINLLLQSMKALLTMTIDYITPQLDLRA